MIDRRAASRFRLERFRHPRPDPSGGERQIGPAVD
jgi:hypothetical protein